MHLYMSGTPRNDPYQTVENRLCTHRLFSMHAEYERPVLRWVKDLRDGILDADGYLAVNPQHRGLIKERDKKRRLAQNEYCETADWDTGDVLQNVCKKLDGRPYPKTIMLDSGAFTAWNKGEETTVDEVVRKYAAFIEIAGDMFDDIWMINLDVIPGKRGFDPTPQELAEAVRVSDINFEILVKEFGDKVLPVFHQGEDWSRLDECVAQVRGKSDYICVSPRNDLAEPLRVKWSRDAHGIIKERYSEIMTHGLATTGNKMLRNVPWYSGDSAAWVQHGGFGMVDIFHPPGTTSGTKSEAHYKNYFVTWEGAQIQLREPFILKDGTQVESIADLGFDPDDYARWNAEEGAWDATEKIFDANDLLPFVEDVHAMPWGGGHINDIGKHYFKVTPAMQRYIRERIEAHGFPFDMSKWDSRVRNLICMAEMVAYSEWAQTSQKVRHQTELF